MIMNNFVIATQFEYIKLIIRYLKLNTCILKYIFFKSKDIFTLYDVYL